MVNLAPKPTAVLHNNKASNVQDPNLQVTHSIHIHVHWTMSIIIHYLSWVVVVISTMLWPPAPCLQYR